MNNTPNSERPHITILGKRNSGKSTLLNAITGQTSSLVSDIPGTTTDPVRKAMEIPGIGPCLLTDTAGFDDDADKLGTQRIALTRKAMEDSDIAILIFQDCDGIETEWYKTLERSSIPVIPVITRTDIMPSGLPDILSGNVETVCGEKPVRVNPSTGDGIGELFKAVLGKLPQDYGHHSITGDLVKEGDTVLLVMPQDIQAPKGRLILPQVQTIRELLDRRCTVISCTTDRLASALGQLSSPPQLIITDSQVFSEVWEQKPEGSLLTSFSILFAGYKGDIRAFLDGAEAMSRLKQDSHILIAEACTHAPAAEDIGRVKIPGLLHRRFGQGLKIDTVSGNDFPQDLSGYDLIIHCGSCMFNRKYVLSRIAVAKSQGVPVTNYGIAIAWLKGILGKVAIPTRG